MNFEPTFQPVTCAHSRNVGLVAVIFIALLVTGCGEPREKAATQTAAKVNDDEITVHQINAELQRAARGNIPQEANAEAASKRILDGLINQTLLVQQAKEAKLDRDPRVLQLMESSRRRILAQAYIERQAAASPPTQEEIKDFYAKNPDLFEKRRVYAFREFLFERTKFTDEMRDQLKSVKSPADIAKVLNGAGIRYRETNSTRPAEALPIGALPRIAKLAKGESLAFTDKNLANVLMLLDYAEQPVPIERATPLIKQYLVNNKKREIAQSKVKELRNKGRIEYVGKFAKSDGDAMEAAEKSAAQAPVEAKQDDSIEKGVQGLTQ